MRGVVWNKSSPFEVSMMNYKKAVKPIILRAHFDGEKIQLDEPFPLQRDVRLTVTVLSQTAPIPREEEWLDLSREHLGAAYSVDEPDYSLDLIKERNPEYEGR